MLIRNYRITNVENSLASLKESVDKILTFLQQNGSSSHPSRIFAAGEHNSIGQGGSTSQTEQQLEQSDFPPLHQIQDDVHKSAPIMIVRKFRPSTRRLYDSPKRDIIEEGILTEDVAERLASE